MKWWKGPAQLALSLIVVMLAAQAQAAEKIVISNWDAYMPKDLLDRFQG
jgi:spermidine/putrescine-binding protein